jgi:hypothetical protein
MRRSRSALEIFNNFEWVIDGCEFDNCATGVTGTLTGGQDNDVMIFNTHFQGSTVMDLGPAGNLRAERVTSSGSALFVNSLSSGNGFRDCWVDSWTNPAEAMELAGGGQASIVDCTFTNPPSGASPPIFTYAGTGSVMNLLLSNLIAPAFPSGAGVLNSFGVPPVIDWVPAGSLGGNITSASQTFLQSTALNDSTHIIDVTQSPYNALPNFTTDCTSGIQAAINAARTANNGSIVYLPGGLYKISSTLTVSGGNYAIEGQGTSSYLCWTGGSGGTMINMTTPQSVAIRELVLSSAYNPAAPDSNNNPSYPVSDPTTITSIRETSTGASKATFDTVIVGNFYYGNPGNTEYNENVPGIVLNGLPAGSTVYFPFLQSPLTVVDCGPAQIYSRVSYIGATSVSGATHPKTGFLGLEMAEGGANQAFTVNDNQNLLVGPFYSEQGANDISLLRGAGATTGHVAVEGLQSTPTPTSVTVNVNNYAGRLYYGNAYLTGGSGASTVQINQTGSNPIDLILAEDIFQGAPAFTLGSGANLIATLNFDTNTGVLADTPNPLTYASLTSLASSMDDFRQLGALSLAMEFGTVNPSGLVAYWKLDETASPSADSTMSGATGTWQNAPTPSTAIPPAIPYADAGSLTFNGTNQYVDMGNPTTLPTGTHARTICGWGKAGGTPSGYRWIAAYGSPNTDQAMFIGMNGTTLVGGGYADDLTVSNFWDGNWHFIALTYDGTTAKLYADGVLRASGPKSWNLVASRCYIGEQVNNAAEFWNGQVDDVRIYNYALSTAQIDALISFNFSFETPGGNYGTNSNPSLFTGWTVNSPSYYGDQTIANQFTSPGNSQGLSYLFMNLDYAGTATITSNTVATIASSKTYKLTVALGNHTQTGAYGDPGNMTISLLANGVAIPGESTTVPTGTIANGAFVDYSVIYTTTASDPRANQNLSVQLETDSSGQTQAAFDNVRLTVTPP